MKKYFALALAFLATPFFIKAAGPLVINEIMYDIPGSDTKREWVEIKNIGANTLTLSDWRITRDGKIHILKNDAHPENLSLNPGELLVVANDMPTFLSEHALFRGKIADSAFALKNTNGTISLLDGNKTVSDSVSYSASLGGGGNNKTLERNNATFVLQESHREGGTPGEENLDLNAEPHTEAVSIAASQKPEKVQTAEMNNLASLNKNREPLPSRSFSPILLPLATGIIFSIMTVLLLKKIL